MAPGRMIILKIDGQPVTVTVDREQLENNLAADGYPADRSVYVTTWSDHQISDHQIDDTPTDPMAAG